jgi:hypothetical protein
MWQVSTWQDSCSTLYFSVRFTPRKTHLALLFDKQPLPLFSPDKVHIINLGARNYSGEIDLSRQQHLKLGGAGVREIAPGWVSAVHTQCSTLLRSPCLFILESKKQNTKCISPKHRFKCYHQSHLPASVQLTRFFTGVTRVVNRGFKWKQFVK